jgi:hypothetical protein
MAAAEKRCDGDVVGAGVPQHKLETEVENLVSAL